jgi:hypothetical protein
MNSTRNHTHEDKGILSASALPQYTEARKVGESKIFFYINGNVKITSGITVL